MEVTLIDYDTIWSFVAESNRIEGIERTLIRHVDAHEAFLSEPVTVESLCALVDVLQPDAVLRDRTDVPGVRVGPPSGPEIVKRLEAVLRGAGDPFVQHVAYETLHPFTDGNGRSGRALWLHRYVSVGDTVTARRGFLHSWYYHSLARSR